MIVYHDATARRPWPRCEFAISASERFSFAIFFCSGCFASCAVNFDLFILRVCLGASLFVFYTSFAKLHVVVLFRFNVCVCVCVNLSHSYIRQKREEFSLDTMCIHKVLRYSYNSRLFFVLLAKISHILIVSRRYVYE